MKPNKLNVYRKTRTYQPTSGYTPPQAAPIPLTMQPIKGVDFSSPPSALQGGYLAKAQNVRLWEGELSGRWGLEEFYTTALDSPILWIEEIELTTGTNYLIILTQKSLYYYSGGVFIRIPWTYTSGTATTDGSAVVLGGSTAWLSNARAGDRFKVNSIGTYVTILSVDSDTQLTLTSPYVASTGAHTVDRYFGGLVGDYFCAKLFNDKFCFSQGVDPVLYWDGAAATLQRVSNNCPACKSMTTFAKRLVLANILDGGTSYPLRVQWCGLEDETDWTGTSSGFEDLIETQEPIKNIDILSNQLIVYKNTRIIHGAQTGYAQPAISFFGTKRVDGTGLFCGKGLHNLGDKHIILTERGVFAYNGSTLQNIGAPIRQEFFDRLNLDKSELITTMYLQENEEWYIFVPNAGSDILNAAWLMNLQDLTFTTITLPEMSAVGRYVRETSYTIDSTPWTIDESPGRFDDRRGLAGNPQNLLALADYKIYNFTDEAVDDNGTSIDIDIQSPDYVAPDFNLPHNNKLTLTEIVIGYYADVACNVVMEASVDGGVSWEGTQTITFPAGETNELQFKTAYFWLTNDTVRFRMRRNEGGRMIRISSFAVYALDGGKAGR